MSDSRQKQSTELSHRGELSEIATAKDSETLTIQHHHYQMIALHAPHRASNPIPRF
jgi:hypothetical protein